MTIAYQTQFLPTLSRHASVRLQQRSIPHAIVDLLLDFAHPVPAGGGCQLYRFSKISLAEAKSAVRGKTKALDRYRNAYLIFSTDGTVVTAGRIH